jgi:hypothetical protein
MNFKEWLIAEEGTYGLHEAIASADAEQNGIKYAIMIANFYKDFKRMPSKNGTEILKGKKYNLDGYQVSEKQLYIKVNNFKQGKKSHLQNKKANQKYYQQAEKAGKNAGLPENWMDSKNTDYDTIEQEAIKYAIMIANFYKDFERMPSKDGSDNKLKGEKYNFNGEQISERQLSRKLSRFREGKKAHLQNKKVNTKYYPSAERAGIEAKLPEDWMDSKDRDVNTLEQEAIKYAIMIANFYKDFERMPSGIGSDNKLKGEKYNFNGEQISERQIGNKLRSFKKGKKAHLRNKKSEVAYHPSAEKAGKDAGLPADWMDSADRDVKTFEQEAIKYAIIIANFYKEFQRMPSIYAGDQELQGEKYNYNGKQLSEKQLAAKLDNFRQGKKVILQGKKDKRRYYPAADIAGKKAGLPENWMDVGYAYTPVKKFINHNELVRILKNLTVAENFNFQPEMVCFREGKSCLKYDGAYRDDRGNPIAVFEYQGEQHYHPTNLSGLRKFLRGAQNDSDKLKITRQNNIPLLRIPFWKNSQMETLVNEFMRAVLSAPNNKLSPSQWNHYAVDIATPDAQQQIKIDKEFCRYFNSPKGKEDAALVALYPEIQKKWKMCNSKDKSPKIQPK